MLNIDNDTARCFILGKQGLWPGRRWRGIQGTEQAMRAMEYLQLDPLQIVARSQDITLYGRVLDYTPGKWEEMSYQQCKFFDWGGWPSGRWASCRTGGWSCAASATAGPIAAQVIFYYPCLPSRIQAGQRFDQSIHLTDHLQVQVVRGGLAQQVNTNYHQQVFRFDQPGKAQAQPA